MKKTSTILTILLLTLCLVGFTFNQVASSRPVSAGSESQLVSSEASAPEKETVPSYSLADPVVFGMIGVVGGLMGLVALLPLLVEAEESLTGPEWMEAELR